MIHLREPYLWLNNHEPEGTDDTGLVTLVRSWDDSGDPAVFLSAVAKAAPDLLDAAKDALGFIKLVAPKHPGDVDSLVEALRAAIDKATGVTA